MIFDIDVNIDTNDNSRRPLLLLLSDLQRAIEYTVNFNMKGLHKIERDVFFPWVRATVVSAIPAHDIPSRKQLRETIDQLEKDHLQLHEWGQALVRRRDETMKDRKRKTCCLLLPMLIDCSHLLLA
jgi:hypothetical protein